MAGVATTHSLYDYRKNQWQRCRDCVAGEDAVKARGTLYLPMLDSHRREINEKGTSSKYEEYRLRALFYNATGRTVEGLSGAIFQKAPSVDVTTDDAKKHITDITLTDEPLEMFALNSVREFLTTGRYGILVDMPTDPTVEPRPYWVGYHAEDIINWKFVDQGGDKELSLVVLREYIEVQSEEDEFDIEPVVQFRVLRLHKEGFYSQQVYVEVENTGTPLGIRGNVIGLSGGASNKEYAPGPLLIPTRRGTPLNFIPFSLPWMVGAPPLLDLVAVNLSHYRGVADLKHGLHYTALPTPWVSGARGDGSKPLAIGSGTAWDLEKDGRAGMLEFTGRGLGAIRTELQDLQRQMATLGARLLEEAPRYAETALSVSMRHSSDYATLRMIAQVMEQQLSYALKIHCWWLTTETRVASTQAKVELNKIFFDNSITADELRALLLALQASTISFKTFYERLSNTGWTREGITSDEELEEIARDGDQFKPPQKTASGLPPESQTPAPNPGVPGSKPTPKPVV